MSSEIVLDIETQNSFADVGGYVHDKLKISLIGVYFYETDTFEYFLEHQLSQLWPRLERAERVIGYNQKGFDNPVINNYYPGDVNQIPQLDILEKITASLGFRVKLDDVAKATIGMGKTGDGLQAILFWKEGRIKELADYCLMDVKVTRDVYEFAKAHGFVRWMDRSQKVLEIPIDVTSKEPARAMNLTLPI